VGTDPVSLVGTPDGTRLFVANKGDSTVNVIDTGSNAFVVNLPSTITVGASPTYLTVNGTGTRVFSVNNGGGNVSVIDTTTNTATNVAVGSSPNFAYFDLANNRLWVTNPGSDSVSSINTDVNSAAYLTVTNIALPAGCAPTPITNLASPTITVLADGSRAYVAGTACNSVIVINALSNTVTKTIPVGTAPVAIVSSGDSSKVYTANSGSGNVSIIRTSDDTIVNTLSTPAGTSPIYLAISPF
jgi:YVTN family beta-propeller protein